MRARVVLLVVILGLIMGLSAAPVAAASLTVNSLVDTAPADDGSCTLREAITAANTDTASGASPGECAAGSGADDITFGVAGTITLASAQLDITSNLTISGAGAITVSGAAANRVFFVAAGTVTLSGLTISGGFSPTAGGGILNSPGGTLTVTNSTISGNTASSGGGGIANLGTVTVTSSTISGNMSTNGGGIWNDRTVTLTNSTISGNTATNGGGIWNDRTVTVTNSTISGNTASLQGGGIRNGFATPFVTLTVTNSTISGNTASPVGGGGIGSGIFGPGIETLVNAIVAGNAPIDFDGVAETITTSVLGVPGGMTLADILVPAGLADNGGPTQTIALALVAGNPAIDTGTSATCAAAPVNGLDQRGQPRPAACDIGAYEAQPPSVAAHANVSVAATSAAGAVVTYTPPTGTDEQGGAATVVCLPASGSTFAPGSTTVTCTATDAVGHTGSGTFQVIVAAFAPTPAPSVFAPTPAPSLPNAATTRPESASPSTAPGFAALLIVSLGVLVVLNARGVVNRR